MGAGQSNRTSPSGDSSSEGSTGSTRTLPKVVTNPCYTKLMKSLHDNIIGDGLVFHSSFGEKRVLYLDYTASGRAELGSPGLFTSFNSKCLMHHVSQWASNLTALIRYRAHLMEYKQVYRNFDKPVKYVEDYIATEIYHKYANTHTSTCVTARQTSLLREGARSYIKQCVNANEDDVLLFTGSGVTGAIHKLVSALQIEPSKTVVLIGPYEHHSNILPWKESGATVHTITQTKSGQIDLHDLENHILRSSDKTVIGSFSAASNVTGIISDVKRVTRLLKKYGALAFWDYATAAPYVNINMNSEQQGSIDAVFISPHKFVGGPQSPGILVAKKNLFKNTVPVIPGGGTVTYVYSDGHEYLSDIEAREEGGTPPIIESIRAALAFKVKHSIGLRQLEDRESYLYRTAKEYWTQNCDHMTILGCGSVHRLPIFSFIVTHPTVSKLVHHNFISTLLNDLYGIQSRGGCACAGPYGEALLGIDAQHFIKFFRSDTAIDRTSCFCDINKQCDHKIQEILKPGFCRLNLPYTISENELQFVLQAVKEVTENGWKLLPLYTYDSHTGSWQTKNKSGIDSLNHFEDLTISTDGLAYSSHVQELVVKPLTKEYLQDTLSHAKEVMNSVPALIEEDLDSDYDSLGEDQSSSSNSSNNNINNTVWFVTPDEAENILNGQSQLSHHKFIQRKITGSKAEQQKASSTGSTSAASGEKLPFNPRGMTARNKQRKRHKLSSSSFDGSVPVSL